MWRLGNGRLLACLATSRLENFALAMMVESQSSSPQILLWRTRRPRSLIRVNTVAQGRICSSGLRLHRSPTGAEQFNVGASGWPVNCSRLNQNRLAAPSLHMRAAGAAQSGGGCSLETFECGRPQASENEVPTMLIVVSDQVIGHAVA